jgi:hypothetical protein
MNGKQIKPKLLQAVTIRKSIIPDNRRVVLHNAGAGLYFIVQAETNDGKLASTAPFSLFLRREDFVFTHWE